jgi:hypothetical protein
MSDRHGLTFAALKQADQERFLRSAKRGSYAKRGRGKKQRELDWWLTCDASVFVKWLEAQGK